MEVKPKTHTIISYVTTKNKRGRRVFPSSHQQCSTSYEGKLLYSPKLTKTNSNIADFHTRKLSNEGEFVIFIPLLSLFPLDVCLPLPAIGCGCGSFFYGKGRRAEMNSSKSKNFLFSNFLSWLYRHGEKSVWASPLLYAVWECLDDG